MRLIFSFNPGRCGSKYVSNIFSVCNNVYSCHEEKPYFDDIMRKAQINDSLFYDFIKNKKIPKIKEILKTTKKEIYLETSHLFSEGFFEIFLDFGIIPDILVIKRDPVLIAKSLFFIGTIPGRSKKGIKYCLTPDDRDIIIRIEDWNELSDFELCYWYVLEMYERSKKYSKIVLNNGMKVYEVSIESLKDSNFFLDICSKLSFKEINFKKYEGIKHLILNSKSNQKKGIISEEIVESSIKKINEYIRL